MYFFISENCDKGESVTFKVVYNKQKHDVTFELDKTVLDLKKHIQTLTGKWLILSSVVVKKKNCIKQQ